MSSIQQLCPSCGRKLQLPAEAIGKTARCPACEATFQVDAGTTQVAPPQSDRPTFGPSGTASPQATGPATPNPFQPSADIDDTIRLGDVTIRSVAVDPIWNLGFEIFKVQWVMLLLAGLITTAIQIALQGLSAFGPPLAGLALGDAGAIVATVLVNILSIVAGFMINLGLINFGFAIARNRPTPLGDLMPPMDAVGKFALGFLALMAVGGVVAGVSVGLVVAVAQASEEGAVAIGIILGLIGFAVYFAALWLLWSWPAVCIDGRSSVFGSIKTAAKITSQNRLTSFLLLIIAVALGIIGVLMCCVGTLVTTPATAMLFAVAFLMITDQPIADPREAITMQPAPGMQPSP